MNEVDIEAGLKTLLADNLSGLPSAVSWPNMKPATAVPRLEVMIAKAGREGGALEGGEAILKSRGVLQITVVTTEDDATGAAQGYAQTIAGLYYEGRLLSITGGQIEIRMPAQMRGGFVRPEDKRWVVPVSIQYEARKI